MTTFHAAPLLSLRRHLACRLATIAVLALAAAGTAAAPGSAGAQSPKPEGGSKAETDASLAWSLVPDPALPDVLILGDSISIGYTLPVRKLLAGKANVFRPMTPDGAKPVNCAGTTEGVKSIDRWLQGRRWAVVHFNWGLHDCKHVKEPGTSLNSDDLNDPVQADPETYAANLRTLVAKLEATGAKLVFATTTPVPAGTGKPARRTDAQIRYNAAAEPIMRERGIRVNDLCAFCLPQLEKIQSPKDVHFTPEGSAALGREVARVIEEELARK